MTLTRRRLLQCAACASLALGSVASHSQTSSFRCVDVHHHVSPPAWLRDAAAQIAATNRNAAPIADWTARRSLDEMDRNGVTTAFASVTNPGIWLSGAAAAKRLARECNEYLAKLVGDHPGRFGAFASIPLPDTDASLAEIAYAFDVLQADGIGLMTSYDDKWLGDPAFATVFEELNRRAAVIYVHPTSSACCTARIPDVSLSAIEFPIDTTRTIASLLFSGRLSACPNIRWIFSHGGAAIPALANRMAGIMESQPQLRERIPRGALHELKKAFYDTALSANPATMGGLLKLVTSDQVLYGTDYPLGSVRATNEGLAALGLAPDELEKISYRNAAKLLRRLR